MNDQEKRERCYKIWCKSEGIGGKPCRPYGRNVSGCEDCAFSTVIRRRYLQSKGVYRYQNT